MMIIIIIIICRQTAVLLFCRQQELSVGDEAVMSQMNGCYQKTNVSGRHTRARAKMMKQ